MKNITYDLIEKLESLQDHEAAGEEILSGTDDSLYYCTLSPDRVNVLDSLPWHKSMRVLQLGACGGVFSELSERTGRWDILDCAEEELALVRLRFPKLCAKEDAKLCLLKEEETEEASYDAVVLFLSSLNSYAAQYAERGEDLQAIVKRAVSYVKPGGSFVFAADNKNALKLASGELPEEGLLYTEEAFIMSVRKELPFAASKLYFPLPDALFAVNIFSEERLPGSGDFKGISESFLSERYCSGNEETLYERISEAGVFPHFAPSYLLILQGKNAPGEKQAAGAVLHSDDKAVPKEEKASRIPQFPVYSRFNRRRAAGYRLKTDIFMTSDGEKTVRKTALSEEANAHVEGFGDRYELLKGGDDRLFVLPSEKGVTEDGRAFAGFPYVKGKELGTWLSDRIRLGQAPVQEMEEALGILMGDTDCPCHNLDALFENVMIRETSGELQYVLLDYEWVFPEELDRRFVRWRILSYWYEAHRQALYAYADRQAFFSCFGLQPEELPGFEEKEAHFQQLVRGGNADPAEKFRKPHKTPADVRAQEARLEEFTQWNLRLQDEIEEHKAALSKEREVERLSQNHIRNIEKINAQREAEIAQLGAEVQYLRKHQSLPSRITHRMITALDAWAPAESRKRKMIRLVKNTVLHPVRQFRLFATKAGRDYIAGDFNVGGEFAEGGILTLPAAEAPLVSIVIPAYNQVAYTYACVRSILANTVFEETSYEVILADDVSTDATKEITRYIHGMVISRNSSNMGFLKNCNQAAAKARGKYIFFLNNDTKVHPGWLKSLTDLIGSDPSIGMVGSKLVYPDGRLQEAGGIIWSDASGWNYGRLDDPDKPEYNYVKDVDYISGAAIMISKALWEEIGGFDERFAPAYCEDSDLAFEVRRHGRRVVYQPASKVTHFEGISNGTDVTGTGLKRYQVVNQQTFREKWAEELKKQCVNTGNPDPFTARDRSQEKPCVVIVDHYVPTWDRDAGSKTTYQYIRMFLKKGFNVKFVGDNFLHEEPYSGILQQMGVEILYGPEYQNNIYEWFRKNSGNIDFCYLNRPHIAVKYIDFLKDNTDIRCIFYGHDLHYLRLLREYELEGEIRKKRESDYWKSVEFSVMQKADMVYYPSQTEIDAIHHFHPEIPARAITAYVWDSFPEQKAGAEEFEKRHDLLFVGGFRHPPNADGVKWFAKDIWPRIHEALPGCRFLIAGSGAGEDITALSDGSSGIEVLGFVSDERLKELYEESRLVVVPLRYGAGVKGKVVEAVYNGCVIVTTSVGAEGIPDAETVMAVTDDDPEKLYQNEDAIAARFADEVIRLYNDPAACAAIGAACGEFIQKHYSIDAAWEEIASDWVPAKPRS